MTESNVDVDHASRFEGYMEAWLWVHDLRHRLVEVRPSEPDTAHAPFPFDAPAVHVLTAFNPGAERPGQAENERRQRALIAELPGTVDTWTAEAGAKDGSHREGSVLVTGLTDVKAIEIGVRWGQDAVFRWTPETWSILPCDGRTPIDAGWQFFERTVPLPHGVALVRRVRRPDGSSATWTVSGGPETWTVEGDGPQQRIDGSLADVVRATSVLRDVEPGVVSDYQLGEKTLTPPELAVLLHVVGEGAEDSSVWPDAEAHRWWDEDIDANLEDFEWRHRWIEIDGVRASAVVVPSREDPLVVVIEDDDHLDVVELLAKFDWSSDGGSRPMSTDGGNSIGWIAPGLLYQRRWGDFGPEQHLVTVGDDVASLARALAEWVDWAEVEQSLALTQEPLDPDGTLSDDVRETILRQLELCEVNLTFPGEDIGRRAREVVAAASASYRRTRDALAHPDSDDGRAFRALLAAVDEGDDVPDSVTWATWQ